MHALIEIFFGTALCVILAILTFTVSGSAREIVEALENLSEPVDDVETIEPHVDVMWARETWQATDEEDGSYVMCGGCGRTVMTEEDSFTPVAHNCDALSSRFEGKLFDHSA